MPKQSDDLPADDKPDLAATDANALTAGFEGPINPLTGGQGAQVALTGAAQAAARGETHGSIEANTAARDAAIIGGDTADPATNVAVEVPPTPVAKTKADE